MVKRLRCSLIDASASSASSTLSSTYLKYLLSGIEVDTLYSVTYVLPYQYSASGTYKHDPESWLPRDYNGMTESLP